MNHRRDFSNRAVPCRAVAFAFAVSLGGCATQIPVSKQVGTLNLDYQTKEKHAPTGKTIAIVSPQFTDASREASPFRAQQQMAVQQQGFFAQSTYQNFYWGRLSSSMQSGIQELFSQKGFLTKGPYKTVDDIPFGDKKTIYLLAVPTLNIFLDQKRLELECKGMVCTDQGTFTVTGELVYKMIEPLTNQALMTKRINLSDFEISKQYVRDYQTRSNSDGVLGMILDKATNPDKLRDNTDLVMTEASNEFYQKAMAKIDTFLSAEELISFEKDIANLKDLKRF